eukprot:Hpha_TRINITY_DN1263_c0_g1::TRINITY_DN1263_c0_g1_i1::g.44902::m.44902
MAAASPSAKRRRSSGKKEAQAVASRHYAAPTLSAATSALYARRRGLQEDWIAGGGRQSRPDDDTPGQPRRMWDMLYCEEPCGATLCTWPAEGSRVRCGSCGRLHKTMSNEAFPGAPPVFHPGFAVTQPSGISMSNGPPISLSDPETKKGVEWLMKVAGRSADSVAPAKAEAKAQRKERKAEAKKKAAAAAAAAQVAAAKAAEEDDEEEEESDEEESGGELENTIDEFCEKCQQRTVCTYYTRQIRSADEGQTTFYTCTICKEKFQGDAS